jgi:hypothetical protein
MSDAVVGVSWRANGREDVPSTYIDGAGMALNTSAETGSSWFTERPVRAGAATCGFARADRTWFHGRGWNSPARTVCELPLRHWAGPNSCQVRGWYSARGLPPRLSARLTSHTRAAKPSLSPPPVPIISTKNMHFKNGR